uniref:Uncharacterized protein n=1 Tax=Tanacetum cinerariifolium TaxID=118510 RepID=A0A6L2JY17_TANCI|nr:hypothetical protein [Tanacetum cinerariifolium]
MFGVNNLDGDEVIVENVDVAEQAKEVVDDITLAKALIEIKSSKPKAVKVNTFVDFRTELVEESSKKAKAEITQEARFENVKPVDDMDSFLLHNLKTMFEHHVEDNVRKNQQGLVKMYPLTNHTLHQMFNDMKLQVDYECEMAFELLRLVKKQLKEGYVSK